jgi:hypothetical protein
MDYREDAFRKKFESAAREFGVKPNQVASLKLRENVHTSEYLEFLETLEREMGISLKKINGNLQGKGYLVSMHRARVIIVEHETGLEILFIVGSITSIIDLMPRIVQAWRFMRKYFQRRQDTHSHDFLAQEIEIRRFDQNGKLLEDHIPDFEMNRMMPMELMNTTFTHLLENEINDLVSQVQSLTVRVEKLEKSGKTKTHEMKKRAKSNTVRPGSKKS